MSEHQIRREVFEARFLRTDFASYLYWRDQGFADPMVCDCFATVLIGGECGGVLTARAAKHTLNAGLLVTPGGMIDERDVAKDGTIALVDYGLRELTEETGIGADDLQRRPGV
ncbi:MAG: hypothetical protein ACR2PA_04495, partial [Hyphomicrobiaceae bacterium]